MDVEALGKVQMNLTVPTQQKGQPCHPERSEGSAQRSISLPIATDPSLRSG